MGRLPLCMTGSTNLSTLSLHVMGISAWCSSRPSTTMALLCYATDPVLAIQSSLVLSSTSTLTRPQPESDRCWQQRLAAAAATAKTEGRHKSNSQSRESAAARPALPLRGSLARWKARLPSNTLSAKIRQQSSSTMTDAEGVFVGYKMNPV